MLYVCTMYPSQLYVGRYSNSRYGMVWYVMYVGTSVRPHVVRELVDIEIALHIDTHDTPGTHKKKARQSRE